VFTVGEWEAERGSDAAVVDPLLIDLDAGGRVSVSTWLDRDHAGPRAHEGTGTTLTRINAPYLRATRG
jgi:hypothetical protein